MNPAANSRADFLGPAQGVEVMQPLAAHVDGDLIASLIHIIVTPEIFASLHPRKLARDAERVCSLLRLMTEKHRR